MKNEPIDKAIKRIVNTALKKPININEFFKEKSDEFLHNFEKDIKEKPELFKEAEK